MATGERGEGGAEGGEVGEGRRSDRPIVLPDTRNGLCALSSHEPSAQEKGCISGPPFLFLPPPPALRFPPSALLAAIPFSPLHVLCSAFVPPVFFFLLPARVLGVWCFCVTFQTAVLVFLKAKLT